MDIHTIREQALVSTEKLKDLAASTGMMVLEKFPDVLVSRAQTTNGSEYPTNVVYSGNPKTNLETAAACILIEAGKIVQNAASKIRQKR